MPTTKPQRAKTQMLLPPTVLGLCVEQTLPSARKPGRLGKSGFAWVVVTLGGCKLSNARGAARTPELGAIAPNEGGNHPHSVAHRFGAFCYPWTPIGLQPSAQNPNPTPQKRHPRQPNPVAVAGLGGNGNRHPCQPGSTRTAITAAVRLRVAVDNDHASPKGRVGLDNILSSATCTVF